MFAENRQDIIRQQLETNGAVLTAKLVEQFGVSLETIRRDLMAMEQQGLLKRVHGGAVRDPGMQRYYYLQERTKDFSEEKKQVARNAMAFVREGDIIFLDEGSTALAFAEMLNEKFSNLTVVTHDLGAFRILCQKPGFQMILCAGHYVREENSFYGSLVLEAMDRLHVQKAFLFPSAVSMDFGIGDFHPDLHPVQKKMLEIADEVFVLADSSKFEKKALLKIADMKREYTYITDAKLPEGLRTLYRENEYNVFTGEELA
ncbi:MAG: DeoR/GlpR transcriptional regulator [Oscillospiraceae bacterium]|nr:DeoR/GlpR transcriptional regulator [Oscillospiraceae bacterium]